MKKFIKSLALIAVAAFGFASCEDVPSPFELPTIVGGSQTEVIEAKGDGTAANPFNVKGLTEWITANEATAKGKEVYVEGVVSSIKSLNVPQYTRAQYYINDTESTTGQFYVYNGLYLNGENFTSNDQLKVGDKVLIKGTIDQYNGAFQIGQNSQILKLNDEGEGAGETTPGEPAGTGSATDPYNVAAVIAYINTLGADVQSDKEVYIKGKVASNTTTESTISQYGNMTFTMVDEGSNAVFTAFQVYGPGQKKFTAVDQIKVGDEVVVCGKVVNYKGNTPETVGKGASYVVSINGKSEEGGETGGETTGDAIEKNCADAAAICLAMDDKATSEETYTVTGYITEVVGSVSKNQQTFWMADTKDGGKVFEAYWANLPEGVTEFTVGSKVKITGKLMRFGSTPEIKNADVEILEVGEGGGETGGDDNNGDDDQNVGDGDVNLVMASLYNITEGSVDAGSVTANGVTLTFDQNGGNNMPKYYWNATEAFRSVRMYAKNKMTVSASKKIESIKINCASPYNGTNYNGNATMTTSAGTLTQNSDNITVVVTGINSTSFEIVNEHSATSGGAQLRVVSVEIVYAK